MSSFSPSRGAFSPSSSLHPFAFNVSASRCRSLPWPCDFIPSTPRLSECSKWYIACLDGMHRHSPGGLVLGCLLSATYLPECLCSLFPNSPAGWLYRSHLSSCNYGGDWPPGSSRGVLLHPSGGHRRLPPRDVREGDVLSRFFLQHSGGRMITSLVEVGSGLSLGSIPGAPNTLGWEASRVAAPSLWL
jgi:hypothetical protein